MSLTQKQLEQLEVDYSAFQKNLETTKHQNTKDLVAFLEKYTPNKAFIMWALMKIDRDNNQVHMQNLASEIWDLKDQINELLGRGNEVIQERDELQAWVKENSLEFKSQLKWVVAIPEESDSKPDYFAAESKELAQRAVRRYRNMMTNRFVDHPDLAESINSSIHYCLWHGTDAEFEALKAEVFHNEEWFKQPMCNCRSIEEIQEAFRDKDIVHCFNGKNELITDSIDEAKRFYGVDS